MVAVSLVPIASVSILLPILIVICCNVHTTNSVRLGDINPSAWDLVTQRMEIALNDSEFKGEDVLVDWRISASKKRLNRELYSKYGILKDIILHPYYQICKVWIEDSVSFDLVLHGDPIMPLATSIIILFMMHKRVSNILLMLSAALLFNINPLYVVLILLMWCLDYYNIHPKQWKKIDSKKAPSDWKEYAPEKKSCDEIHSHCETYDHIIIGNDISTLYTAALLSRNGHRCCVLQSNSAPRQSIHVEGTASAVTLCDLSISKIEYYQVLLDAVNADKNEERIKFHAIGSPSEAYTYAIIRTRDHILSRQSAYNGLLTMRAGALPFNNQMSINMPVGKGFNGIINKIIGISSNLSSFVTSRIIPTNKLSELYKKDVQAKQFIDDVTVTVSSLIQKIIDDSASTGTTTTVIPTTVVDDTVDIGVDDDDSVDINDNSSSASTLGDDLIECLSSIAIYGAGEVLLPSECSVYALSHALNLSNTCCYYPTGGYQQLEKYLCKTIRRSGGCVYSDAHVDKVLIEDNKAVGVGIGVDGNIRISSTMSVVSGLGVLNTYTRLIDQSLVAEETKKHLAMLLEARPKVHVVYWLYGCNDEFGLSAVDYIDINSQSLAGTTGLSLPSLAANKERLSSKYVRIFSPSAKDGDAWMHMNSSVVVVELESVTPIVTISSTTPYKMYTSSCEASATSPAGTTLKLSKSHIIDYKNRATLKLKEVYPKCIDTKISHVHVVHPSIGGHKLSCTTSKFSNTNSSDSIDGVVSTHVKDISNLYMCGSDISTIGLSGEIQAGYAAASAVLGYQTHELTATGDDIVHIVNRNKNIITDLNNRY